MDDEGPCRNSSKMSDDNTATNTRPYPSLIAEANMPQTIIKGYCVKMASLLL
jgi:hypothetical protein